MDIGNLRRDVALIEQGDWVDEIPGMGDLRLLVRGMSAPEVVSYQAALNRAAPSHKRDRAGNLTIEASTEILVKVLSGKVLMGWENLDCDGEPIEYSPEIARELIANTELSPFADAVLWAAGVVDRSKAKRSEDMAKNSRKPSGTASKKANKAA